MTAHWIAVARAAETLRADPLFLDSLAVEFVARTDPVLLADLRDNPTPRFDVLAVRTKFFDDFLSTAVRDGLRQVVIVAAGMDSRAYRLDLPAELRLFEIDLPDLQAGKEALLAELGLTNARCRRRAVAANMVGDWSARLRAAGFDPGERTAWLIEGFLYYLTDEQVEAVLDTVSRLSAEGSVLGLEHVNTDLYRAPWMQQWLADMRREGRPWQSGVDEPEAWLARHGFRSQVREPADLPEATGRRVPKTPPRPTPGAARTWLITAERAGEGPPGNRVADPRPKGTLR
ncbi:SAM-dependent methyltransferase [Micromonospora sp. WMMD882]|uniref:SAM-dependent methyltransferase n=1 Tax=Micromonospora sp. WMMD882 TaxID=3015151 RepID=UPI00248D2456|nr:SAM-dependent methyltransferase [Micromonospora sp. WMMD882]WBB77311.1 SAM-dependent methyltransferase [Micromonospora sp. WMMD882]